MSKVISKLNNLKSENFDQPVVEERTVKISLLAVLKESKLVQEMHLGESAILTGLKVEDDKIVLDINSGKVKYEEDEA